ncbi:MAG: SEC-C domain-containing protein [Nitrospira sp.]|jgi:hypothetical protein|nr:SEC-C domain-containing protein [Nitrospira sp.]SLM44954.1 conserved hypothetical protein [Nitrospira sp. ND1]
MSEERVYFADKAPCWCESGDTYAQCHKSRASQTPLQPHEIVALTRKAFSLKTCLHPPQSSIACSHIIDAHSISISTNLKVIAENGHVLHFSSHFPSMAKNGGQLTVGKVGVNKASTFAGFCHAHDSRTFSAVDDRISTLTDEHCFLLAYRAICQVFFTKQCAYSASRIKKIIDRGKKPTEQFILQEFMNGRELGLEAGLRDLKSIKSKYDDYLQAQHYSNVRYYAIELDHSPPLVCSVGTTPDFDFDGNRIQSLEYPETHADIVTCSIICTDRGSAIVFAWIEDNNGACSKLMTSLRRLKPYLQTHAVLRFIFEYGENVFFSPSWWEGRDTATRDAITQRANRIFAHPDDCLMDDGVRADLWSVAGIKSNLDLWRIASTQGTS